MSGLRGRRIYRLALVLTTAVLLWSISTSPATAYPNWDPAPDPLVAENCDHCHSTSSAGGTSDWDGSGPHGGYVASTNKCQVCHVVHNAPGDSVLLLRGTTATDMCLACHDGTGSSIGVYATIESHGETVTAGHRVEATNVVPGGSNDLSTPLSCSDCHAVHAANTVVPFLRDSGRAYAADAYVISDCLLRDDVGSGVAGSVPKYGAAWCAACHDARHSDSPVANNHPVDGDETWGYGDVRSTIRTDYSWREALTGEVATGLGRTNSGYLMAPVESVGDGRIEEVDRRAPMCQQCHEDARNVDEVFSADYTMRGTEPWNSPINPAFLTFPHQTTNSALLVEEGDDLCLNCHAVTTLP